MRPVQSLMYLHNNMQQCANAQINLDTIIQGQSNHAMYQYIFKIIYIAPVTLVFQWFHLQHIRGTCHQYYT